MAQPVSYERQSPVKFHQPRFPMPDPLQTSGSTLQLADMMSRNGHPQKQQKFSRLQMMKQNYEKKRQKDEQERREEFQANARNVRSRGTVRAFFAERRAMEATAKDQESASYLPPIGAHFKQVKDQNQFAAPPQGSQHKTVREAIPPPGFSYQANRKNSGRNRYYRNKSKGVDKLNPLPPLQRDVINPHKPPTPNRRYETHASLIAQEEEEVPEPVPTVQRHVSNVKKLNIGPVIRRGAPRKQHVPKPPPKQRTAALDAQKRAVPNTNADDANTDDDRDNDAWSSHTDEPPPNFANIKALRMRRISRQQSNVTKEDTKLTDFQKWQMQQDKERQDRLEQHRKNAGQSDIVSLSMRERELLERIKLEQEKLSGIKRQQEELEEQERREKEEDEIFNRTFKKADFTQNQRTDNDENEENQLSQKPLKKEEIPTVTAPKKIKKIKPQPEVINPEPMDMDQPKEDYISFYIQQAEKASTQEESLDLTPCTICGRKFQTDRLERHQKVCLKNSKTKRKVFDTVKQRVAGMEHEKYVASGAHKKEPEKKARKADWRTEHENFIKALRYAKGNSDEPPPVLENPHYVQCPHCERKFNPETADRHIPRCKDIKARPAPPKTKRKK